MSRGSNYFFLPTPGPGPSPSPERPGQVYGAYSPNDDNWNYTQSVFPRFVPSYGVTPNARVPQDQRWPLQERPRIPPPPHPPMQIIVLNNPHPRPSIPEAPPRLTSQWNMPQAPPTEEDSLLIQGEQNNALKKLRKEIYNPTPKRMIQRINIYYRDYGDGTRSGERRKEVDDDDDGKRCAVCLDDFEPRQAVMVTPCDHMFHEECIMPWVKSHGQCPVCRFVISEVVRQSAVTSNNNGTNVTGGGRFAEELVSIIRAMEEALEWRTRAFH